MKWKTDFPVNLGEDAYATRREFAKFLGLSSVAFAMGSLAAATRRWVRTVFAQQSAPVSVAASDEMPVGSYKLFHYPTSKDPCILIHLAKNKFVAFEQKCTHLSCPVFFNSKSNQLVCPCHHGFFNAEDGQPVAGPPKRPLLQLAVSVEHQQVWVKQEREERV